MKKFFSKFLALSLGTLVLASLSGLPLAALNDHFDITTDQQLVDIIQEYAHDGVTLHLDKIGTLLTGGEQFSLQIEYPNGMTEYFTINFFQQ